MVRPWYRRRWLQVAGAVVVLALLGHHADGRSAAPPGTEPAAAPGSAPSTSPSRPRPSAGPATTAGPRQQAAKQRAPHHRPPADTAWALLATLPVKGRAPQTGYEREAFGQAWLDADRNGCDTRNDILRRDLHPARIRPGTYGCLVESGVLRDPYTATTIHFVRGDDSIDIDHVVALSDAWQTGAFRWDVRKRAAFANDPMNLLAVDSSANRQKGDGDTATWLPANRLYRCAYAGRQVSVKAKYGLWVTPAERAAMARILAGCPGRRALSGGAPTVVPFPVDAPHAASPAPTGPAPRAGSSGAVSYQNCDAVRAAGAAPIHRGDPGYAPHLDRDGDGVGCE